MAGVGMARLEIVELIIAEVNILGLKMARLPARLRLRMAELNISRLRSKLSMEG